ncbi:glycosyltransferase 87 family protein [Streptomyces hilarionis]|uniref:glycosyltransferase 87 family protein n=1 Tax=Streptomyces hilarionis TaxID=2839954 RepID=UPI002795E6CB|nr:glycosyltransferase 87 family protein [Streptomyces hilarionis]
MTPRTASLLRPPGTDRGRVLLVLASALAVAVFTATVPLLRDWFDLRVYYGTVNTWIHDGGRVYDYRVPGTPYGFTYPPFAAVVMAPMALVGLRTAIVTALLLDLAALAVVVRVLCGPGWRRHGWYGAGLAACALALFEPLRDTVSFGQVNLLLLALVLTDVRPPASDPPPSRSRSRLPWPGRSGLPWWAGAGIGLAAAIKLTPALFIGLLFLVGRRRAAAVATAVAFGATAFAALVAPDASRFYWTRALWDTSRVGRLDYVSNQSLQGVLARLGVESRGVWAVLVVLVLCGWAWRTRRAAARGDLPAAFALTGLTACLVSPVTWVHHLVWLLPSFAVLIRAGRPRVAGALYAVLCTSVVWLWFDDPSGVGGFLGANAYTWVTLGLLGWLPVGQFPPDPRPASRVSSAMAAPPSAAAPTTSATSDQPPSPSLTSARSVAAVAAVAAGADRVVDGAGRGGTAGEGPERAAGPRSGSAGEEGAVPGPDRGSGCGPARSASSEPTGSTRPAAANPQSSSSRASS